jgi:Dolichyl-phosphate-mannose-protein mannosyltransferase
MNQPQVRPHLTLRWLILVFVLPCFAAAPIVYKYANSPRDRVHEDEVYWIGSTYYYHLAFVERDWTSTDWQLLPARENPPLGKYVMGAALHLRGRMIESLDLLGSFYLMFANTPGAWGTGEAWTKRNRVAMRVDPDLAQSVLAQNPIPLDQFDLQASRQTMCFLAVLAAIGLYVIGLRCGSRYGGLVSAILFGLHPIVIPAYTLAMIDMVALCFSILFIAGLLTLVSCPELLSRYPKWTICLTGILLALACGSKMNALVVVAVAGICASFLSLRILRHRHQASIRSEDSVRLLSLLVALVIAFAFFVAFNPTLHNDFVGGLMALVQEHRWTADIQETFVGRRLASAGERWTVLSGLVGLSPLRNIAMLFSVAWQLVSCYRKQDKFIIVVLWLLLSWMPFSWSRYALPLVPPTVLVMGKTLADLVVVGRRFVSLRSRD